MKNNNYPLFETIIGVATIISCIAAVIVVPEIRMLLGLNIIGVSEEPYFSISESVSKVIISALVIGLGAFLLFLIRYARQPIRWDFSGFLGMAAFEGRDIHIARFQARGINESKQNFREVSGFIESNINGERIPILLDSMLPEETGGIPSKGEFWVGALFRDPATPREGIQAEKFLQKFSDFTFVIFLGKKKYQHRFPRKVVEKQITSFWKESNPPPKPSITKKNN